MKLIHVRTAGIAHGKPYRTSRIDLGSQINEQRPPLWVTSQESMWQLTSSAGELAKIITMLN